THTHPILPQCTDDTVREELQLSKEKLEAWTGKEVKFFAYPNGDFTPREISTLKDLDYKLSFANNPQYLTPETLRQSPYSIPRFGFLEGASFVENICRMAGVWNYRKKSATIQQEDRGRDKIASSINKNNIYIKCANERISLAHLLFLFFQSKLNFLAISSHFPVFV